MNLDELRSVQNRERQKDDLQDLRDSFYEEVGEYIAELKAERERAADEANDPFASDEVRRLSDELETAKDVATSIYERRIGKVINHASLAAADYAVDTDGLTEEETALFESVVSDIQHNKDDVLSVIEGSTAEQPDTTTKSTTEPTSDSADEETMDVATAMGTTDDSSEPPTDAPSEPPVAEATPDEADLASDGGQTPARTTVRITSEVGDILGIDEREYDLAAEDVVTLPEENASPLIEQDAAEPIGAPDATR